MAAISPLLLLLSILLWLSNTKHILHQYAVDQNQCWLSSWLGYCRVGTMNICALFYSSCRAQLFSLKREHFPFSTFVNKDLEVGKKKLSPGTKINTYLICI